MGMPAARSIEITNAFAVRRQADTGAEPSQHRSHGRRKGLSAGDNSPSRANLRMRDARIRFETFRPPTGGRRRRGGGTAPLRLPPARRIKSPFQLTLGARSFRVFARFLRKSAIPSWYGVRLI